MLQQKQTKSRIHRENWEDYAKKLAKCIKTMYNIER